MSKPVHLPDAMPEIIEPTLIVVCGSHECRFIDAGGKTLLEKEMLQSKEAHYTDRETTLPGPGGLMSGTSDRNQYEQNRVREFANSICGRIASAVQTQGIRAIYLSGPGKMLSLIRDHLQKPHAELLTVVLDGIFVKEPAQDLIVRFRPDFVEDVKKLHDQENYSSKKHPPQK